MNYKKRTPFVTCCLALMALTGLLMSCRYFCIRAILNGQKNYPVYITKAGVKARFAHQIDYMNLSPDGRFLNICSEDDGEAGAVYASLLQDNDVNGELPSVIYNTANFKIVATLPYYDEVLAFSPNNKYVITGPADRLGESILRLPSLQVVSTYPRHFTIHNAVFLDNHRVFFSGYSEQFIYDFRAGRLIYHSYLPATLSIISADGSILATYYEGCTKMYKLTALTPKPIASVQVVKRYPSEDDEVEINFDSMAISPDDRYVLIHAGQQVVIPIDKDPVVISPPTYNTYFISNGDTALLGTGISKTAPALALYNLHTRKMRAIIKANSVVDDLAVSPNGRIAVYRQYHAQDGGDLYIMPLAQLLKGAQR